MRSLEQYLFGICDIDILENQIEIVGATRSQCHRLSIRGPDWIGEVPACRKALELALSGFQYPGV